MNQPTFKQSSHQGTQGSQTLESIFVTGNLRDLACELTVEQVFVNHNDDAIEAVYTFPLPHGAVLLGLNIKIDDRELKGSIVSKKQAENRYEEAISEGDGAIMLEQSDDGVCTVNLGNLLPNQRASLRYEYAYLLSWEQDIVKFRLPTTIAPRYGDPITAGYLPHQVPVTNPLIENRFSLQLTIEGLLAKALVESPTHEINAERKESLTVIRLSQQQAFMDRDFVLNIKSTTSNRASAQSAWDEKTNLHTVLASFNPQLSGTELSSVCVKVVVDCSGSMAGNAIQQAQAGLRRILDNLRESDCFNIICFGDHYQAIFPNCVEAAGRHLRYARQAVEQMAANMGGTEMASALDFTYALEAGVDQQSMVLLITDGEINGHREVIRRAVNSGHRVFTVGVGAAVGEEFVKGIADRTGGACELVTPNENMAEAIFRQFQRMYQPMICDVIVKWPSIPNWQTPENIGAIFAGDTVHVYAGFAELGETSANLIYRLQDGTEIKQAITFKQSSSPWRALPRLATAERIHKLSPAETVTAEAWAVDYQLLTKQTNFLVVDIRDTDQKAQVLPKLVQVQQMLAAGWAGNGVLQSLNVFQELDSDREPFMPSTRRASKHVALDYGVNRCAYIDTSPSMSSDVASISEFLKGLDAIRTDSFKDQGIFSLIETAGDDWLAMFIDQVLPMLTEPAQQLFNDMTIIIGHSKWHVSLAILFAYWEKLGKPSISQEMQQLLTMTNLDPELIVAFKNIEIFTNETVCQN